MMDETSFPKTLVIIPALNERESIARVIGYIREQTPWADIVVVNDGSSDDTASIAASAGAFVLHMPYNVGIGASVQTGFMFADLRGYEIVIRNDGDGQHAAQDIPIMLRLLRDTDADIVIGSRYLEDRGYTGSTMRRLGSSTPIAFTAESPPSASGSNANLPGSGSKRCASSHALTPSRWPFRQSS